MTVVPRSILVVEVAPFGKAVFMVPALRAIRESLPATHIAVAAPAGICELAAACRLADETIDLGVIRSSGENFGGTVKRIIQLSRSGSPGGFDWVLDFSPRVETQVASVLRWRARHVTPSRVGQLFEQLLKRRPDLAPDHAGECASVLKQIGIRKVDPRLVIPVSNEESLRFEKRVAGNRSGDMSPIVVIYSSRAGEPGEWSVQQFGDLAWRMANNFDARIVAAEEPSEQRFGRAIKPVLPPKAMVLTAPGIFALAAALERASLVITDERGVAKLATDMEVPVVEISDAVSPLTPAASYRMVGALSRSRVEPEAVYEAACAMIQGSRTASLFGR